MFLFVFTALFLFLFHELYWKRRHLPAGPMPIPLIGNMLSIYKHSPGYEAYRMWTQRFGGVYTIWLGVDPTVVITDYDVIKKTIIQDGDSYADRPLIGGEYYMQMIRGGDGHNGVFTANGELWKNQRRFSLQALRNFGMGRNVMEEKVLTEVETFLWRLAAVDSTPVNMAYHLDNAVGSVINNILFGHGFDTEERLAEFAELKAIITELMVEWGDPLCMLIARFPVLANIPCEPFNNFFRNTAIRRERIFGYYKRQIARHRDDDNDQEPTDFVEAFRQQQRKTREATGSVGEYDELQLQTLCHDMWIAGMETSSNTMAWAVLYLLRHPECQERMHAELAAALPAATRVTMADRARLPYMCAVINETQRLANIVPNLQRSTVRDVVIEGHRIPAGTNITPQISAVMYDEKHFPSPLEFDPTRFLAPDGTLLKAEQLIPFSVGKRVCLGESLARMELFLYLANLFLKYEIRADGALPSAEKKNGLTIQCLPFTCRLVAKQ